MMFYGIISVGRSLNMDNHPSDETRREEKPAHNKWYATRPLKIAAAEDTLLFQKLLGALFSNLNHKITIVDNGKKAVELVEADDFDLVIMDIQMPIMDGLEAAEIIRSLGPEKSKIPIIALTTYSDATYTTLYQEGGINGVCEKPFHIPELLKTIDRLLGEKIHISNSDAAPNNSAASNLENNVPVIEERDFDQVLESVSSMIGAGFGVDNNDRAAQSAMAAIIGDSFDTLLTLFEIDLSENCLKIKVAIDELERDQTDFSCRDLLKELTHKVKGCGGTFGYDLSTTIAAAADDLLFENSVLTADQIRVLKHHADALVLVADEKLCGRGGKAGRALLQGLKDCS